MPLAETKSGNEGDTTGIVNFVVYLTLLLSHMAMVLMYVCDEFYITVGSDEDDTLWMESMGITQEQTTIMYPCMKTE